MWNLKEKLNKALEVVSNISEKVEEKYEDAKELTSDASEKLLEKYGDAREIALDQFENAKNVASKVSDKSKKVIDVIKEKN